MQTESVEGDHETEHYFLQNQKRHRLLLNYNGIYPASFDTKLGLQKNSLLLRNLGNVLGGAKQSLVSMIDVIVVKKYPVYFTEFIKPVCHANDRVIKKQRSLQTYQYLFDKQQADLEREIHLMISANQGMNHEQLEEKVKQIKERLSFFKPWFKIKVYDTFKPSIEATITLFDISQEAFLHLQEGQRLRIISAVVPANSKGTELQINVVRTSKVINMTDLVHKKRKEEKIIKFHQSLVIPSYFPNGFREVANPNSEKYKDRWENAEIEFYA